MSPLVVVALLLAAGALFYVGWLAVLFVQVGHDPRRVSDAWRLEFDRERFVPIVAWRGSAMIGLSRGLARFEADRQWAMLSVGRRAVAVSRVSTTIVVRGAGTVRFAAGDGNLAGVTLWVRDEEAVASALNRLGWTVQSEA